MSDLIAAGNTVTFTITKAPRQVSQRKTLERLMGMQPFVQKGLSKLSIKRRMHDNKPYIRAGVLWVNRKKVTRLSRAERGEEFTLTISQQIVPDLKSVSQYLDAKSA